MFAEGVLWIVRTGSPWRDLPEAFGDWNSVFRRFSRWSMKGVEATEAGAIARDAEVGVVPAQHRSQPRVLVAEPLVHPSPHLLAQLLQLADHPLPLGLLAEENLASRSAKAAVIVSASCRRW